MPAVAEVSAPSALALVATVAAERLSERSEAEAALASVELELARLDQEAAGRPGALAPAGDELAVAAEARARRAELTRRRLDAKVVLSAAGMGHDQARRDLAGAVARTVSGVSLPALEQSWAAADPRRLEVLYTALRQVGDPYVFHTAGPDRFDCSGLTKYAWQTSGVRLAHYSFTQRTQLPATTADALQPGDLVFNLRPSGGHVMLSLGVERLMVHAPAPGRRVEISRWRNATGFGSPFAAPPVAPAEAAQAVEAGPADDPAPLMAIQPRPAPAVSGPAAFDPDAAAADEVGARYGIDPAILVAAGPPTSGVLAALGAIDGDDRSVLDATARYLVAATAELGDVASAIAALDVGAGVASAVDWPDELQERVIAILGAADDYRTAAGAGSDGGSPASAEAQLPRILVALGNRPHGAIGGR